MPEHFKSTGKIATEYLKTFWFVFIHQYTHCLLSDLPSEIQQWSTELEASAQRHSDACVFEHDTKEERQTTQWPWVGQNIAYASTIDE